MRNISVALAESPEEIDAVRHLSRAFRQWLYDNYSDERAQIELYYSPEKFEAMLADLPKIHARPQGAIFLARLGGEIVGCVMQHEIAPGISEMKRLFVSDSARGSGAALALCEASLAQARKDGYRMMRLDTGHRQIAAQKLYRRLGFQERDAYYEIPEDLKPILMFFEREL